MSNRGMAQIMLQPPRVHSLIRQGLSAGMAKYERGLETEMPQAAPARWTIRAIPSRLKRVTAFVDEDIG